MKETTKNRLKKVAKGVGFGVLGLFATIGIVATIASLSMCDGKSEANPTRVALRQRRDAPRFDESANVYTEDNVQRFDGVSFFQSAANVWDIGRAYNGFTNLFRFPSAGFYYISVRSANVGGRWWLAFADDATFAIFELGAETVLDGGSANFSTPQGWRSFNTTDAERSFYVYVSASQVSDGFGFLSTFNNGADSLRVYALDLMRAEASDYVSLPDNWKPFNLVDLAPNANGFGTASKRSGASLSPLGYGLIDGLLFRSNGSLYNRIEVLPWTPFTGESSTEAHTFGYYDATGSLAYKAMHLDPDDGLILWQIRFSFVPSDIVGLYNQSATDLRQTDVVAQCPQLDGVQIDGETRTIYLSGGALAWNSPLFRELEVLDVYKTDVRPTDALMARSPLEWLRLSLASVSPTPSAGEVTIGDGMTLVNDGLTAIVPVLGIEVLPSVSLGLLLFLPLIGGIIVLIVKVFSK